MRKTSLVHGLAILGAGLFASSVSSFLGHLAILGRATDLVSGVFDGLAAVAFALAIFVLVRGARATRE